MLPRQLDPLPPSHMQREGGLEERMHRMSFRDASCHYPSPCSPRGQGSKVGLQDKVKFLFSSRLSCADTIRRGEQESIGTSTITSLALTPSHTVSASLPSLHVCVSALASIRDPDSSMVRESGCRACRSRRRTSAALALSAAACTAASAPCVGCKNSVYRYVT